MKRDRQAAFAPRVGEVQEGDRRRDGTDGRPQAERGPAIGWWGRPLLMEIFQ